MNMLLASDLQRFSRREFLTLLKTGGLALFWLSMQQRAQSQGLVPAESIVNAVISPSSDSHNATVAAVSNATMPLQAAPLLGRVLDNDLRVYNQPSFTAKLVNIYWRDLVFPINAATIGDQQPEHNRVWYLLNNEGYVHSGLVQPVGVQKNQVLDNASIPPAGRLAEISVPYTDARRDPNTPNWLSYRLYYGTTHWIREALAGKDGQWWYRISDDKFRKTYYVDARHLRPLTESDLAPITVGAGQVEKRLEVRLADQLVIAYEDGSPVFMTRTSTGARFIDGDYTTPTGRYITNRKRPSRHMAAGDLASSHGYDLPGVPWVSYLTLSGISFHGTYWHNDFGKPRSHGCLNLCNAAANWIYRWTLPGVPFGEQTYTDKDGTLVDIVE
jgi:hypothetical protein